MISFTSDISCGLPGALEARHQPLTNVSRQLSRACYTPPLNLFDAVSPAPKEYRKVTNKSFGPRYAEGFYLHSDSATPSVWMFDMISKTAMMLSDFKAYSSVFTQLLPRLLVV